MAKKAFKETYKATLQKPYPTATEPEKGLDNILTGGFKVVRIEISAAGKGLLNDSEVEFLDLRVYITD